jgi:hypothetical protein
LRITARNSGEYSALRASPIVLKLHWSSRKEFEYKRFKFFFPHSAHFNVLTVISGDINSKTVFNIPKLEASKIIIVIIP